MQKVYLNTLVIKFRWLSVLYVQNDPLLLVDIFQNFRNKCLEIDEFDPARFLPAPGLSWQAALKMKEVQLQLWNDIDMLLMKEKGIRGGMSYNT